jgi:hypothetical protein
MREFESDALPNGVCFPMCNGREGSLALTGRVVLGWGRYIRRPVLKDYWERL